MWCRTFHCARSCGGRARKQAEVGDRLQQLEAHYYGSRARLFELGEDVDEEVDALGLGEDAAPREADGTSR